MGRAEGCRFIHHIGVPPPLAVLLHPGPPEVTRDTRGVWGGQLPTSGHSGLITKGTFIATQERETLGRL